ncbi:hypothetical protein V2J09_022192 [Rumex salicifolius]
MALVEEASLDLGIGGAGGGSDHGFPTYHKPSPDSRQYSPAQIVAGPGQPEKQSDGFDQRPSSGDVAGAYRREMEELQDMFSKLNPMAKEFVPPSLTNPSHGFENGLFINGFWADQNLRLVNGGFFPGFNRRKKGGANQGKRRNNTRTTMAQREEVIRRTVYVSDIDQQVTEEQLAALFINCGQVVDCRICGDPNSVLRFAFIEFTDEGSAGAALSLSGTMLGYYPVKVLPSKTAIAPVNPNLLPRTEDEREMCARTIYCTNIDKKVTQTEVKLFFESVCGEVHRLRILGDYHHSTRIAFVEFVMIATWKACVKHSPDMSSKPLLDSFPTEKRAAPFCKRERKKISDEAILFCNIFVSPAESAIAALNCSGVVLGSLPIRVSPSKTPVRPRAAPRQPMN